MSNVEEREKESESEKEKEKRGSKRREEGKMKRSIVSGRMR